VGLCGQAPSDRPAFATFLADAGLDSISVTPDAFAGVVMRLGR
jgi:pyruvate,water dikinase